MIQGSEDAVLWLQLSEPLTVGMFGDLRAKKREGKRRTGDGRREKRERARERRKEEYSLHSLTLPNTNN